MRYLHTTSDDIYKLYVILGSLVLLAVLWRLTDVVFDKIRKRRK